MSADMSLKPTEELVVETLVARHRLGENVWSFTRNSTVVYALNALQEKGVVGYKSGVVGGSLLVWLTDEGKEEFMKNKYLSPIENHYYEVIYDWFVETANSEIIKDLDEKDRIPFIRAFLDNNKGREQKESVVEFHQKWISNE